MAIRKQNRSPEASAAEKNARGGNFVAPAGREKPIAQGKPLFGGKKQEEKPAATPPVTASGSVRTVPLRTELVEQSGTRSEKEKPTRGKAGQAEQKPLFGGKKQEEKPAATPPVTASGSVRSVPLRTELVEQSGTRSEKEKPTRGKAGQAEQKPLFGGKKQEEKPAATPPVTASGSVRSVPLRTELVEQSGTQSEKEKPTRGKAGQAERGNEPLRTQMPSQTGKKPTKIEKRGTLGTRMGKSGMEQLREQTPQRRRERMRSSRRLKLESLHRANFRRQFRVSEKSHRSRGFYLKAIGATLAFYLLFLGGAFAFFASNLLTSGLKEQGNVRYTIGTKGDTGYVNQRVRYGELFRDGVMYLNMNHIATLCDLTTTGDREQMRYYSRGEQGHSVIFQIGSQTALVNGTPVTLEGACFTDGDTVYVSADFFTRFASGIDLVYNTDKSTLTVTRVVVATSIMKGDTYAELTFALQPNERAPVIDYSSLDPDLRLQIEATSGNRDSADD